MQNTSTIILLSSVWLALVLLFAWAKKMKSETVFSETVLRGTWKTIHMMHLSAILAMLFPALMIHQLPTFLLIFPDRISLEKTLVFLACFATIGLFPWKNLRPQVDRNTIEPASPAQISLHVFQRIVFLISYEWFVRGLLLITCCSWLGMAWGVIINTVLYVVLHVHKDKKEMLGCIPFGLLLCAFTIWWQTIWPAIIFHLQLAIVNEWPDVQQFLPPSKRTAL